MLAELLDERGLTASEWASTFAILEGSNDKLDEDDSRCKFGFLDRPSSDGIIIRVPGIHWEKTVDTSLHRHLEDKISVSGAQLLGDLVEVMGALSASLDDVARETNDFAMLSEQGREKTETLLQGTEGKPIEIDGDIFPTVWAVIGHLAEKQIKADSSTKLDSETVQAIEAVAKQTNRVPQVESDLRTMWNIVKKLVDKLTQLNNQLGPLDQRVKNGSSAQATTLTMAWWMSVCKIKSRFFSSPKIGMPINGN